MALCSGTPLAIKTIPTSCSDVVDNALAYQFRGRRFDPKLKFPVFRIIDFRPVPSLYNICVGASLNPSLLTFLSCIRRD